MGSSAFKSHSNLGMTGNNAAITRGVVHQKGHEGKLFLANQYDATVTASVAVETLVTVPSNTRAHLRIFAAGTGDIKLDLFKSTTVTAAGSAVTAFNTNQNSSNTAEVTVTKAPTLTDSGTAFFTTLNPGGYGINDADIPGGGGEVVLPAGNYLVRTTNVTSSAIKVSVVLQWYETTG